MWQRPSVLAGGAAVAVLIHHYLIHGYWFDTGDLLSLVSHEALIVILVVLAVVLLRVGA